MSSIRMNLNVQSSDPHCNPFYCTDQHRKKIVSTIPCNDIIACFLFLVIQWLVSQVLESRQTRGDVIRRYATWQFDQHFGRDHQQQQQQQPEVGGLKPASRMANVYLPKRKFRQKVTYIFFCYFM